MDTGTAPKEYLPQSFTCSQAFFITHLPSGMIRPVSSATGMKSSGGMTLPAPLSP